MNHFNFKREVWYKIIKTSNPKWINKNLLFPIKPSGEITVIIHGGREDDYIPANFVIGFLRYDYFESWFKSHKIEIEIDKAVGRDHLRAALDNLLQIKNAYELDDISISTNDDEYKIKFQSTK